MVAIVSGNSLGLNVTSKGVLGNQGVFGDPTMGQGGEQVYVNASNGNLVMQQLQDQLMGAGLDVSSVLTYNSLGLANDDNADNFSLGKAPVQLQLTTGPVNTVGSVLTRTAFDGSQTVYTWDAANSRYVALNGAGAFDTITYVSATSKYTWVDGATQTTETYDGTNGRLLTRTDPAGNTLTFGYDATSGMLTSITDTNGETVTYVYSGNLLQQIKAPVTTWNSGSMVTSVQPVVSYFYDTSNRLASVKVDLTPADGSISDNNVYTTSFTYDGTSKRAHSVTQSDGTSLTIVYDGSNRVSTITDALGNVTTFTYDTVNLKTSVLAGGQTTVYAYNASGQLVSVTAPAVGGVNPVTTYAYNGNGEVTSIVDLDNHVTTMTYDAAGNQTSVLNSAGDLVTRVYDSKNRLVTETTAMAQTPAFVSSSGMAVSGGNVTKSGATSAYDASVRSAVGYTGGATVSFTAANSTSRVMVGLNADPDTDTNYTSIDYAIGYSNNGVLQAYTNGTFVANIGNYVAGDRLAVSYDGSGHVNFTRNGQVLYAIAATPTQALYVDSSFYTQGSAIANLTFTAAAVGQTTRYVYSADGKGLLRYKISADGRVTEFGYDAKGQLTSSNEYAKLTYSTAGLGAGVAPSEATMNTWRAGQDLTQTQRTLIARDSRGQVSSTTTYTATAADGTGAGTASQTTFVYDPSGRLLQAIKPGSATTIFVDDGLGRLTSTTDALNRTTTTTYADAAGTIAVTYANQLVTTSYLDKDGRLTKTINASQGTTLTQSTVDYDSLGHVLRTTDLTGVSTWYLYDADGRKVAAVDGNGALTEYVHDNAGLVTETIAYATPVNTAALVDGTGKPNNPSLASVRPAFNASTDHRGWSVYDASGRLVQSIDALGAVTQFNYDGSDQLTSTVTFATKVDVSAFGSAPAFQFVSTSGTDRVARNFYDGDGHLTGALDPDGYLTVYQYDAAGQRTVAIRYATKSPAATDQSTLAQLVPAPAPGDQRTVTLYDMEGRVTGQIDALGYLTQTVYNLRNTVDHVTRYATPVGTAVAAGSAVDAIKPAPASGDTTTSYVYDADDRVTSKTDPAGLVTTYTYDPNTDALVSSTTGYGRPEAATTQTRYDALGRPVAVLDGVGSALITAGMTQAQIDAVWTAHAVTTSYDLAGRRTSTTDALQKTTLYFYDADGQLRYTVDPLNNVKELRYDAFGHVVMTIGYASPITPNNIGSGGLVTANLITAVANIADGTKDQVTRAAYDQDGRLAYSVDPMGAVTQTTYDAFGNVAASTQYATPIDLPTAGSTDGKTVTVFGNTGEVLGGPYAAINPAHTYTVTVRMRQVSGSGKVYVGVITKDANGNVITNAGNGGTYAYCATSNTLLTPDMGWQTFTGTISGTQTTTAGVTSAVNKFYAGSTQATALVLYNCQGSNSDPGRDVEIDSISLYDNTSGTTLTVDPNLAAGAGGVTMIAGSLDSVASSPYATLTADQVGARLRPNTAADAITRYVYDADGRVTLTVDPTGAATQFTYDASGNVTQTRQYANTVTPTSALQVNYVASTNSSAALNLGTFNAGDVITATVRFKTAPPADGHLVATKLYVGDGSSNGGAYGPLLAATGDWQTTTVTFTATTSGVPLYVMLYGNRDGAPAAGDFILYDNLRVSSTQKGVVYNQSFDSVAQGTGVGQWGVSGSINQISTDTQLQTLVNALADSSRDRVARSVYDADGRVTLSVDPAGAATSYTYDANGNVTQKRDYANTVPSGGAIKVNYVSGTNSSAQTNIGTFNAGDVITVTVRFKAAAGVGGMQYVGDYSSADSVYSSIVPGTDGWVTMTLTHTMTKTAAMMVFIYGNRDGTSGRPPAAGDFVLYDNLTVSSTQKGVVTAQSFDSIPIGSGFGQWQVSGSISQVYVTPSDAGTDAQLQTLVSSLADATQDRIVNSEYDTDGRVVWQSDALGNASRIVYDVLGRPIYAIAADGAVTRNDYDSDGRVLRTTTFSTKLTPAQLATLPHATSASQLTLAMQTSSIAASPSDHVTANQYDALGRLRYTMDGTGAISEMRYDANGNIVDSFSYATQIDLATWNVATPPTVTSKPLVDRHVHASYDAFGNVIAQSDGTGAVVVNTYDARGQITDRVSYANRITAGSWTSGPLPSLTPDSLRDIHERFVHDALGQLTYSADGTGAVTAYTYDVDGRVTQKTSLATLATSAQPLNAVAFNAADRTERFSYDTFGRQVWHLDVAGALDYTSYDTDGRVAQTIRYAQTAASLPASSAPLAISSTDRVSSVYYNAFGEATYTIDALNRAALNAYDQAGHLLSTTQFAGAIANGLVPSSLTVPADAVNDQKTSYVYDAVGRVTQRTDAMMGVQTYGYDGVGNKLTLIDEKNQIWAWTYDADGRELTQTSPSILVTSNAVNSSGDLVDSSANAAIVTSMTYDGMGHLLQRIDGFNRADARTTAYVYDAAGRQVSVQGPAFSSYSYPGATASSSAPVSRTFYDAFGNVVATVDALNFITYTTYDQANRVAFSVNQLGYVTGNVRNTFGEVLTQTTYAGTTSLIGAVPARAADAPTTASVASTVNGLLHAADRTTSYAYSFNATGRSVTQTGMSGYFQDTTAGFNASAMEAAATPTTTKQYNAFGELVLVQQLANQASGLTASTYHYFDNGGQETDTVDAMGYQTHRTFDNFGNATQTKEYGNAKSGTWSITNLGSTPTTSATDRTSTDLFDRLNRRTSETRTLDYSATDDGVISGHTVTTSWGYDAQGHVTRTTDAAGATTYQSYDALGRLRAVIAPARSSTVDGSTITPVTEYSYDAFGETTLVTQRANSATSVSEFTGAWTSGGADGYSVTTNAGDRATRTAYNAGGHAIQVDDPMASTTSFHNTFNQYDANGRLVYTYHAEGSNTGTATLNTVFQGSYFDAAGQVTTSISSAGTDGHKAYADQSYNAFGEVVSRGIRDNPSVVATQEVFKYDNNGHVWLTNSGSGVYTAYVYDLQGNVSSQMTSQGATDISGATSIANVVSQSSSLRVTNSAHDLNGRVRRIDEPTRSTVDAGVTSRIGATSWTVTQSGNGSTTPNTATLNFNSLAALGSGQVRFMITYKSGSASGSAILYADSDQAAGSFNASWFSSSPVGLTSITQVQISKKDVNGIWQNVGLATTSGVSRTQIEVDAPDDPRSTVSFSYTKAGGSAVQVGLTNFGSAYSFDSSSLAAGNYTYTTTVTAVDGSTVTHTGSFTVGSGSTVNGTVTTTQVTPSVFQTFDRWGNLITSSDPRNAAWLTTNQYDSNNQLISQAAPGQVATQYYYDQMGRQVASKDGNGNIAGQKYDQAGHVIETDAHADVITLVKTVRRYDIFGRVVQSVAADGFTAAGAALSNIADFTTQNAYDADDNLLSVQHGTGAGNVQVYSQTSQGSTARNLTQTYAYDSDGHRLSSWDGTTSNVDGSAVSTLYAYDAAGNLVDTTLPATTGAGALAVAHIKNAYDDAGHLTDVWDANQAHATWKYDYFGSRTLAHTDFGGDVYTSTYSQAGDLLTQTSKTAGGANLQNLSYAYNAAGNQTQITDNTQNEVTKYAYDLSGRHVQETVTVGAKVYQDNHISYDAAGRMMDSADDAVHVSFQYDNAGNRTFIGTHVLLDGANNLGSSETDNASDGTSTQYFSYDGLNRQLHVSWTSLTSLGTKGHTLSYDADGNRLTDTFSGNVVNVTYDGFGTPTYVTANGAGAVTETYTYDADDRLLQVFYGVNNSGTTQQILIDQRLYDGASRVLLSGGASPHGLLDAMNKIDGLNGIVGDSLDIDRRSFIYDERGEITSVATFTNIVTGMAYSSNVMTYSYDEAGNKIHTALSTYSLDGNSNERTFTNTTDTTYAVREAYLDSGESSTETSTFTPEEGTGPRTKTVTKSTTTDYDANGFATKVWNVDGGTTDLTNDAQGRVLRNVVELSGNKEERNLIINGQEIGQYGATHSQDLGWKPINDFSFSYRSLEDQAVSSSTSIMVAQGSQSLADIAASVYGDRALWRRIAAANGYNGNARVNQGQRIVIAGNPGAMHNDASTFRAYDPSAVAGQQTPYGRPDVGTMTGEGNYANVESMTEQEQSDYTRDVYGHPWEKPFTLEAGIGPMIIEGATAVDGSPGQTGSAISDTHTVTTSNGTTIKVNRSTGKTTIIASDGSRAYGHLPGHPTAAELASSYSASIQQDADREQARFEGAAAQAVAPLTSAETPNSAQQTFRTSEIQADRAQEVAQEAASESARESNRMTMGAHLSAGHIYTAGTNDGWSNAVGSSSPQKIGNARSANGSTSPFLKNGQLVFVPDDSSLYGDQSKLGQATLDAGNTARELTEQGARETSRERFLAAAASAYAAPGTSDSSARMSMGAVPMNGPEFQLSQGVGFLSKLYSDVANSQEVRTLEGAVDGDSRALAQMGVSSVVLTASAIVTTADQQTFGLAHKLPFVRQAEAPLTNTLTAVGNFAVDPVGKGSDWLLSLNETFSQANELQAKGYDFEAAQLRSLTAFNTAAMVAGGADSLFTLPRIGSGLASKLGLNDPLLSFGVTDLPVRTGSLLDFAFPSMRTNVVDGVGRSISIPTVSIDFGSTETAQAAQAAQRTVVARDFNYLVNDNNGILSTLSKDGIVDFKINAVNSPVRGVDMFDKMMGAYGEDVSAIRGNWMNQDVGPANKNLGVVNSLTSQGVPLENAVTQTWTAQQAARYGFTNPSVQVVVGEPGAYTKVETLFTKP